MTPNQIEQIALASGLDFETMDAELLAFAESLLASRPAVPVDDAHALGEGYRRGIKDAFHLVNMLNANRQGRTADETCSYIVRTLAEQVNNGEVPTTPAQPCGEDAATGAMGEREAFEDAMLRLSNIDESAHEKLYPSDDANSYWALWKEARAALTAGKVAQAEPVAELRVEILTNKSVYGWRMLADNLPQGRHMLYASPAQTERALTDEEVDLAVEKWFTTVHEHIEDLGERYRLRMRAAFAAVSQPATGAK